MSCNTLKIAEGINTIRKSVLRAYRQKDEDYIRNLAIRQAQAGADIIDVNAGTDQHSESDCMVWAIEIVQEAVDLPLCIDSPNPSTIRSGFGACRNKKSTWANSVTLEKARMEGILPLVKEHGCPVVGLCMDENVIPETAAGRIEAGRRLADVVDGYGIPLANLYLDALIEPVGVRSDRGLVCLNTIRGIKSAVPEAKTVLCLSAVSFGLPGRRLLNRTYLPTLIYEGIDAVILDVLDGQVMASLQAAQTLLGRDENGLNYIRAHRDGKLA